jgi:hypothetical protein
MPACFRYRLLFLVFPILAQSSRIARADALEASCVSIQVRDSEPVPNVTPRLDVTLKNECGKDVAYAAIQLRPRDGGPSSGGPIGIEWLEALVIPAEQRAYDILHSGESTTLKEPANGLTASTVSASVACLVFVDRTAVGDKEEIRRAADILGDTRVGELRERILAKVSDFDAAKAYFRDAHPVLGSFEEQFVVTFSQAFRTMSQEAWNSYIEQQTTMTEALIALHKSYSEISTESH